MTEGPKVFYDTHGNSVSLEVLCRTDPLWASAKIRQLNENLDELRIEIDRAYEEGYNDGINLTDRRAE